MTERDQGPGEVPEDEFVPADEDFEEEPADGDAEPVDESEEDEGTEPAEPVSGARGGRFLGNRRILGRGAVAEPEHGRGRVGEPVRGHYEARVRVDDRPSAAFAILSAVALVGLLVWALTFAPGAFLNPNPTPAPLSLPPATPTPIASPVASPSGSSSVAPSASASPSASSSTPAAGPTVSPTASAS